MIVRVDDMTRDVRLAIDMNKDDTRLLATRDPDTASLDEVIRSKLCDGVRLVEMEAPVGLLEQGHQTDGAVTWTGNGRGWILLPDDFMRLVAFKMSDWRYSVSEAMTSDDASYSRQFSRWKGISGNAERPVVAIVNRPEGMALEFFSCDDETAFVERSVYVPFPRIDENGGIDVSERCYRAAVYRAASLVLASVGDQLSTTMIELSKSVLA